MTDAFLATDGREIRKAHKDKKTAVFLQVQGGGEIVGEDLTRLDLLHELGLKVFQMTHHHNNPLAGGGIEVKTSGLTKLGYEAVERLNNLNIIPDLSHSSDQTALDVIKASKKPVILSHGAVRAIVNHARCAPDEVIRAIAGKGGVMGIFMMSFWLTYDDTPTPEAWVKNIKHVINVGGIDAVGVSNDYPLDGEQGVIAAKNNNGEAVKNYLGWWQGLAKLGILGFEKTPKHVSIIEFNNIRRLFTIHETLSKAGFKSREIEKIMGGNWIRVLSS
jgi:membrane dipeptidase